MNRSLLVPLALFVVACGPNPANEPEPQTPTPPATASATAPPPSSAEAATAKPAATEEPMIDGMKKSEYLAKLAEDRAKLKADVDKENARWTPEMHAATKALADKTYPSGKAAITAMMAGKYRRPGDADRDKYRHPADTLAFFGFSPKMTVLEFGPGGGWYTELLAPALAKQGKLLVTSGDPNGPADQRSTLNAQRFKAFLDSSPEAYGKVEVVPQDQAKLDHEGKVDMILLMRELHGMVNDGSLDGWLKAFHAALKPNGVLGIEEHRAKPDANPEESAKKGYVPEKYAIERIEAAGFKLAGKSEINANPKDTKDYDKGVWTLPPTYRLGDKDREKYAAIGESDRMTLKFVKVEPKGETKKDTKTDGKTDTKTAPKK